MAERPDPRHVEDPELRPREERGGDRREDGELAEDGRPLERDRDRVEGPGRGEVREALGHHGRDRDRGRDRDGQPCREHGPPGGDEPSRQQVHGHGRQREESAFATLNQSYAASTLPARRMIAASISGKERPEAEIARRGA